MANGQAQISPMDKKVPNELLPIYNSVLEYGRLSDAQKKQGAKNVISLLNGFDPKGMEKLNALHGANARFADGWGRIFQPKSENVERAISVRIWGDEWGPFFGDMVHGVASGNWIKAGITEGKDAIKEEVNKISGMWKKSNSFTGYVTAFGMTLAEPGIIIGNLAGTLAEELSGFASYREMTKAEEKALTNPTPANIEAAARAGQMLYFDIALLAAMVTPLGAGGVKYAARTGRIGWMQKALSKEAFFDFRTVAAIDKAMKAGKTEEAITVSERALVSRGVADAHDVAEKMITNLADNPATVFQKLRYTVGGYGKSVAAQIKPVDRLVRSYRAWRMDREIRALVEQSDSALAKQLSAAVETKFGEVGSGKITIKNAAEDIINIRKQYFSQNLPTVEDNIFLNGASKLADEYIDLLDQYAMHRNPGFVAFYKEVDTQVAAQSGKLAELAKKPLAKIREIFKPTERIIKRNAQKVASARKSLEEAINESKVMVKVDDLPEVDIFVRRAREAYEGADKAVKAGTDVPYCNLDKLDAAISTLEAANMKLAKEQTGLLAKAAEMARATGEMVGGPVGKMRDSFRRWRAACKETQAKVAEIGELRTTLAVNADPAINSALKLAQLDLDNLVALQNRFGNEFTKRAFTLLLGPSAIGVLFGAGGDIPLILLLPFIAADTPLSIITAKMAITGVVRPSVLAEMERKQQLYECADRIITSPLYRDAVVQKLKNAPELGGKPPTGEQIEANIEIIKTDIYEMIEAKKVTKEEAVLDSLKAMADVKGPSRLGASNAQKESIFKDTGQFGATPEEQSSTQQLIGEADKILTSKSYLDAIRDAGMEGQLEAIRREIMGEIRAGKYKTPEDVRKELYGFQQ